MLGLIQRVDLRVVGSNAAHMIRHNVDHHEHVSIMRCLDHALQLVVCSKEWVHFLPVLGGIAMVVAIHVLWDWRDPDRIEAQLLNVVKMVLDSLKSTTTVVG